MDPAVMITSRPRDPGGSQTVHRVGLVSGELAVWVALRRVHEGGVAVLEGAYYHHGCAVPCFLTAPLAELINIGFLIVGDELPTMVGMRPVTFTTRGSDLYEVLCGTRGVAAPIC